MDQLWLYGVKLLVQFSIVGESVDHQIESFAVLTVSETGQIVDVRAVADFEEGRQRLLALEADSATVSSVEVLVVPDCPNLGPAIDIVAAASEQVNVWPMIHVVRIATDEEAKERRFLGSLGAGGRC